MIKSTNLIISILVSLTFFACANDDEFSIERDLQLSFSSDTISFDTVFSTIGSATRQFKIYNNNSKSLVIESIELMNPSVSGFRMNIDGEKGTKLTNLDILKKDSLFGFLEVTVNPQQVNNPVLIRDSIKFITNGNIQYMQLAAIGQDVFIWENKSIISDTTITSLKPLLIYNPVVVRKGVTLTIEEGTKFYMKNNASIDVRGRLNAKGSVSNPIVFRGDRMDNVEGNIPYNNVPGQWNGISFSADSYDNLLKNVHIRNAKRGLTFSASNTQKPKATLLNTVVHNTTSYGMSAANCKIDATNCLFSNSGGYVVTLFGGEYSFLHCTLANYYNWSARIVESLYLSNYSGNGNAAPLKKCDFINSIIYGTGTQGLIVEDSANPQLNFTFQNCLIKGKEIAASNFVNTIWNRSPEFKDINSKRNYFYNFELKPQSSAIDKADKAYSSSAPFDLKGNSRLNDSKPDIGCYEYAE